MIRQDGTRIYPDAGIPHIHDFSEINEHRQLVCKWGGEVMTVGTNQGRRSKESKSYRLPRLPANPGARTGRSAKW